MENNYFNKLKDIDVSAWVEKKPKKNRKTDEVIYLSFLSWANAWKELKTIFPDANYKVYENADGWNYHTDGRTAWVKVGVTVADIEHIETLPVYDYSFTSIPLEKITSDNVNTAIQRCLTKAIARHGLGLGLYAGEDIAEVGDVVKKESDLPFFFGEKTEVPKDDQHLSCSNCGALITQAEFDYSSKRMGRPLCRNCQKA